MPALQFDRRNGLDEQPAGTYLCMRVHQDLLAAACRSGGLSNTGATLPVGDGRLGLFFAGTDTHIGLILFDLAAMVERGLPDQVARAARLPVLLTADAPSPAATQLLLAPAGDSVAAMFANTQGLKRLSGRSMTTVTDEVVESLLEPRHMPCWGFDVRNLRSLSVNICLSDKDEGTSLEQTSRTAGRYH